MTKLICSLAMPLVLLLCGCPGEVAPELVPPDDSFRSPFGWGGSSGGSSGTCAFGAPCTSASQCQSGICLFKNGAGFCTIKCTSPAVCQGASCLPFGYCDKPPAAADGGVPPADQYVTQADTYVAPKADQYVAPKQDTQAPMVSITYPAAGQQLSESFTVTASLTDDVGITTAKLYVDNTLMSEKSGPPWDFQLNLTDGQHTLRLEAFDASGKQGSASVSIAVKSGSTNPPLPNGKKKFNEDCQLGTDCESGLCAYDSAQGRRYCTKLCAPTVASSCPVNAACLAVASDKHVCAPIDDPVIKNPSESSVRGVDGGMCAMTGDRASAAMIVLLLGLFVLLRRRR